MKKAHVNTKIKLASTFVMTTIILVLFFPSHQLKQTPNEVYQQQITIFLQDYNKEVLELRTLSEKGIKNQGQWVDKLIKTRNAYKKIELITGYLNDKGNKNINGGPVYSFKADVIHLFSFDPRGLQVLEEEIHEQKVDWEKVNKLTKELVNDSEKVTKYIQHAKVQSWQLLEASKVELIRILTLGITGFDSPVLQQSIPENKIAFEQVRSVVALFYRYLPEKDKKLEAEIEQLFDVGMTYFEEKKFNKFDRFNFVKNSLNPIYEKIVKLHQLSNYEFADEVYTYPLAYNSRATGIFQDDFLNPYYSVKGNANIQPSKEQIELGKTLFFDPIMSKNNQRACASCHKPELAFTDGNAKSIAFDEKGFVARNSPTLVNCGYQTNFFWDMRSHDVNDQINRVIRSEKEFNTTDEEIVNKLRKSNEYIALFNKAFPNKDNKEPIRISRVKAVLEIYVRNLNTLNSPFDKAIRSEKVVSKEVELGFNIFMGKGACATCHFAPVFNGTVPPHFLETEGEVLVVTTDISMKKIDEDLGRYDVYKKYHPEVTGVKGMFKTPTVRNVELTAPYMHNGGLKTLEEVVEFYDKGGGKGLEESKTLPSDELQLTKEEEKALVAFMKSLTDIEGTTSIPAKLPSFNNEVLNSRPIGGAY